MRVKTPLARLLSLNQERFMSQSVQAFAIGDTSVRQLDGLFSLNDLHAAAGGEAKHQPALFARRRSTRDLVQELLGASTKTQTPLRTINDGTNNGTYACRELVIAYAAWISAAFHLKVIRVFLDAVSPGKTPYSIQPHQTLSAEEAAMLRNLISSHAQTLPKDQHADFIIKAWSKLKAHFGVSYRQIPAHEFTEAVSIIGRHMAGCPAPTMAAPKALAVDRAKLNHIYTDLGRLSKFATELQSRIDGLGMRPEDLPPGWWQAKRLPQQLGA
jgi:hypothetical protein